MEILICPCGKEFEPSTDASGTLVQILTIINHLQNSYHQMEIPRHTKSTSLGETFKDRGSSAVSQITLTRAHKP